MKTIVMEKPDRISLPDEMHPSYLDVGEYGIITKSVYLDLVGTLVISVWRESGVMIVSLKKGNIWSFPGKVGINDNCYEGLEFKVKRVVIDQIVCHYAT